MKTVKHFVIFAIVSFLNLLQFSQITNISSILLNSSSDTFKSFAFICTNVHLIRKNTILFIISIVGNILLCWGDGFHCPCFPPPFCIHEIWPSTTLFSRSSIPKESSAGSITLLRRLYFFHSWPFRNIPCSRPC